MDKVIEGCGKRGIKVILDYHRMHLTWENEIGTWWDKNTPESVWINNWASLAKRYKGNPTIIGVSTVLHCTVVYCTVQCMAPTQKAGLGCTLNS